MRLPSETTTRQVTGWATIGTGLLALWHIFFSTILIDGSLILIAADIGFLVGLGVLWISVRNVYDKHDEEPLALSPAGSWKTVPDMSEGDTLSTLYTHDMAYLVPLVWIQVLVYLTARAISLKLDGQEFNYFDFERSSPFNWYGKDTCFITIALFVSMSLLCFLVNQEAIQATFWGHDTPRPFTEVGVFRLLAALYSRLKRAGAEERTPIIERVDGETIQDAGVAVPAEIQTLCGVQSRLHASLAAKPAWTLFRKFLRAMAYEPLVLTLVCNGHPLRIQLVEDVWRTMYWFSAACCIVGLVYTIVLIIGKNDTTPLRRREGSVLRTVGRSILFSGGSTFHPVPASANQDEESASEPPKGFIPTTQCAYDIYQVFATGLVLGLFMPVLYALHYWYLAHHLEAEFVLGGASTLYIAYTTTFVPQVNRYFWCEDVVTTLRPMVPVNALAEDAQDAAEAGQLPEAPPRYVL